MKIEIVGILKDAHVVNKDGKDIQNVLIQQQSFDRYTGEVLGESIYPISFYDNTQNFSKNDLVKVTAFLNSWEQEKEGKKWHNLSLRGSKMEAYKR